MTEIVFDLQPNDDAAWRELSKYLAQNDAKAMQVTIKEAGGKQRTVTQNAAIRKYWDLLSIALNDAGFSYTDFVRILKQRGNDVPWDKEKVGDAWRMVQGAMFPETKDDNGNVTTTKLNTVQVSQVYDVVNSKIIDMTNGVSVPFPDRWGA